VTAYLHYTRINRVHFGIPIIGLLCSRFSHHFVIRLLRSIPCVCVCVFTQKLQKEMTFDLNILHDGSYDYIWVKFVDQGHCSKF